MKKAIYAVSGDPIHRGHIDILQRSTRVFERVVLAIGVNPDKHCLFSPEERVAMARRSLAHLPNVEVVSFEGLLVDYAYEQGIEVIVKGVRNANDFDYENMLHQVGESQELGIDTFVLFARPALMHVSSPPRSRPSRRRRASSSPTSPSTSSNASKPGSPASTASG